MTSEFRTWRVAVTRDDERGAALASALSTAGLLAVPCPVLVEAPPDDPAALAAAARALDSVDWVVCASVRAVRALRDAAGGVLPPALRTAAVGPATARAIAAAGTRVPPVLGATDGAEGLWEALACAAQWRGTRVLVLTTPGGRSDLTERLRAAGAVVSAVDAYRMVPRPRGDILDDWLRGAPDAVVVASARAATTLCDAIGADRLRAVAVAAIGATSAAALDRLGVPCTQPARASFDAVARLLAARQAAECPA